MGGFQFKKFYISQENTALKVGTDSVILGSYAHFVNPQSLLDIGTGTGILSLMMAQKYACNVLGIDIDDGAVVDAQHNVENSEYKDIIDIEKVDIQSFACGTVRKFDGVICNPPFFSNSLGCSSTQKTIARHTCNLTPKELFCGIQKILKDDGSVFIIIPYQEKVLFNTFASEYDLYEVSELLIFPFENSTTPNRVVVEYAKQWHSFNSQSLHIRNANKMYSEEYVNLTKEFYVHLR